MKRIAILLMFVIIVLTACSNATETNNEKTMKMKVDHKYKFFQYDVDDDGNIYTVDKEEVNIYDMQGRKKSEVIGTGTSYSAICINQKSVYILDLGESVINEYNLQGELLKQYPVEVEQPQKMEVVGENIILFQYSKINYDERYITIINKDSKNMERMDYSETIQSFFRYSDDAIIIHTRDSNGDFFSIYNIKNKTIVQEFKLKELFGTCCYDPEENVFYYAKDNSINKYDCNKNEQTKVVYRYINSKGLYELKYKNGYIYAVDIEGSTLYRISTKGEEKNSIIIVRPKAFEQYGIDYTSALFCDEYNDTQVQVIEMEADSYATRVKTKVMSGDNDFDVLCVQHQDFDYYCRSNLIESLSSYNFINKAYTGILNGVKENCSYYDNIMGVPAVLNTQAWVVNEQNKVKLGFNIPDSIWTWKDFWIFAKQVKEKIGKEKNQNIYLINTNKAYPPFMDQYISQFIDVSKNSVEFNIDMLKDMLNNWKWVYDQGMVQEKNVSSDNCLFSLKDFNILSGDSVFVQLPVINNDTKHLMNIDCFCISKHSKNKELAARFLEKYISDETQIAAVITQKGISSDYSLLKKAEVEKQLPAHMGSLVNESNFKLYSDIVNRSTRNDVTLELRKFISETCAKFMEGETTAEETAKLIEEKVQLMIGE